MSPSTEDKASCERIRALLVEDNPGDARLIQEMTREDAGRPVELHVCGDLASARDRLSRASFDVILCDLGLPDSHGLETVTHILAVAGRAPVLVLTGQDDSELSRQCLAKGAQDYVHKSHVGAGLNAVIHNAQERYRLRAELEDTHQSMQNLLADSEDGVIILDSNSRVFFLNRAARAMFEGKLEVGAEFGAPITGDDATMIEVPTRDGERRYLELRSRPTWWHNDQASVVNLRDVSERQNAQQQIEHLNSVLRAIRNVNQLIVAEDDPETLIEKACALLIETRGYNGAWIGLGDAEAPSRIFSGAGWGDAFDGLTRTLEAGAWPPCVAEALAEPECHVVAAPKATCASCALADHYADSNAVITVLRHESRIYGVLGVSFPLNMAVDREEKGLLLEVAGDIAFALHKIELEREKSESESRLAAAVQGGNVGLWDWNLVTNQVIFSNEWKAQIGYAPDEIAGTFEEWERRVHADDLPAVREQITRSTVGPNHPYEVEFRFRHKDGTYRWILARALVECGHDGTPVRMYGSHVDVTELRQQRELHERAQRVAHVGHWELDSLVGTPIWSDEIYRMVGLTPQRAAPAFTDHNTIIHADDWPRLRQAMRAGFEEARPYDLVLRLLKPGGEIGWMHAIGEPELDETGKTLRMFGTAQDVTALTSAERLLAKAQELGSIGSWYLDLQTNQLRWTDETCRLFGASIGSVVTYEFFLERVHPDDRLYVDERWRAALGGAPYDIEHRILVNGETRWVREKAEIERNATGQVIAASGFTQDVTELKSSIEQLTLSEKRFRKLFENSLAPIMIADHEGRYVDVNPAAAAMFQIAREHFRGLRVADLVTPMPMSASEQFEEYKGQPNNHGEFVFVRGDGETRHLLWSACEIAPGEYASVLQDITELEKYQQNLWEEKERAQQYLDVAAVMLLSLDPEGRINLLNRRGCEVLGFTDEESALGQDWFEFIPEDVRTEIRELHRQYVAGEAEPHRRVENKVRTLSGDERTVVWHNAVIRDPSGEVIGTLSSGEDVTERRHMEAQLAQADRLSSMGMLAAGVAHEINNPLAYVLYNLESLGEDLPRFLDALRRFLWRLSEKLGTDVLDELTGADAEELNPAMLDDMQSRLKSALGGTYRIRDVSRGLGTFSRVEKDQLVPVNLMYVIEVALNMAFNEIKYRARLVKDYGRNLPLVLASEGRLGQVFLNLVINATHAIEEGDLENNEIRIRTWGEGDFVFAQVRDTGSGIPPENLNHLFEPFFTTKKIGVGSGLGLAISKDIVEGYGGSIEVESEIGKGTCFTIRLPVQAREATSSDDSAAEVSTDTVRGRILIVDDEEDIRVAMVRMLKKHETVQAASGAEAKTILAQDQRFDLILCDMMMPDVSGMDLHRWLTTEHPVLARQLIFVTGGAFTPKAREYLSQVDNVRLEKPFDRASFKRIVNDTVVAGRSTNG